MANLSRHIKQVHKKIEEACPVCGKVISKANLSKHVRYVHKVTLEDWEKLTAEQCLERQLKEANGSISPSTIRTTPNKTPKRKSEDEESSFTNGKRKKKLEDDKDYFDDAEKSNEDYAITDYPNQPDGLRAVSRPKLNNHNQYSI